MPIHVLWIGADQAVTKRTELPIPIAQRDNGSSWRDTVMRALAPPPVHGNVFGVVLSFIWGSFGWWLARRYAFSTRASLGWAVFIFLLGIAGLLTFLCLQEWPSREVCPNCRKRRVVDSELCEHCAAPFAPPAPNGTEIFESIAPG